MMSKGKLNWQKWPNSWKKRVTADGNGKCFIKRIAPIYHNLIRRKWMHISSTLSMILQQLQISTSFLNSNRIHAIARCVQWLYWSQKEKHLKPINALKSSNFCWTDKLLNWFSSHLSTSSPKCWMTFISMNSINFISISIASLKRAKLNSSRFSAIIVWRSWRKRASKSTYYPDFCSFWNLSKNPFPASLPTSTNKKKKAKFIFSSSKMSTKPHIRN